ncbi:MAG: glycosyltransferase family 4 protein [Candidatus Paceibacterota bacterium]
MKILSISVDGSVFKKDSAVAKRTIEYGEAVDKYVVLVPVRNIKKNISTQLSEKVFALGIPSGNSLFGLFSIFTQAKRMLKGEKFDLITVGDQYYLALLSWFLAKRSGVGLNLQIHGFEKYSGIRKLVAKFVIPRADSIRVVSQRLKRQMIEEFGAEEEKITAVPIFVERGTWNVERVMRNDSKFVFLTVGRLVPVKNIQLQIEAMAEIAKKYPQTELWVAGDGLEKSKIENQISNFKLENNIKMLSWQEDVRKLYEQADAFLLTSNYEGWGMVVIEAASYGLPIIMTDVGCAGEVIKNPSTNSGQASGMVIPIGNKNELIKAMVKLMEDANLRKKIGRNAQEAIKKLPNKERTLELYEENWAKTTSKKIKICYVLPKYDQNDHTHFFHIRDFLKEISKEADLLLIIRRIVGKVDKNNLRADFGVKEVFSQKYVFPVLRARLKGYKNFYVHYSFLSAFNASLITKILGGKAFYWNCGLPWEYKRPFFRDKFERLVYKTISFLVTGAKSLSLGYAKNYNISPDKIKIMPNWIDLKRFKNTGDKIDLRKKLGIPENKKIILFVHHLTPRKGSHMIAPVAKALLNLRKDIFFIVIGSGLGEIQLRDQIKKDSLESLIELKGNIPNSQIPNCFSAADIFFMPSQEEGFPRVILESMAMEVPFVASNVGAVAEIVPSMALEYLITPNNISGFAEKLDKILSMPGKERLSLGLILKEHVKRFDVGIIAKNFIELFRR